MAGGLMQLVAYGAQDVYLTGNPKITFFQAVYKRHTNFAMENIEQVVNGSPADNGRLSVTIARNGDLVSEMYMELQPATSTQLGGTALTDSERCWIAERAVQDVELTIGGQRIDKHYQRWWRLYAELYLDETKKASWGKLTTQERADDTTSKVFLPLIFFFNRNPGLALPLIALQYHEVRLDFDLSGEYQTYFDNNAVKVWANYIYLDTEERRRFSQKGHEYLIEQVQHTGADSIGDVTTKTVRLSYNHPVKELVWCVNKSASSGANGQENELWAFNVAKTNLEVTPLAENGNVRPELCGVPHLVVDDTAGSEKPGLYETPGTETDTEAVGPLASMKLILNGQDRFKEQSGRYFNQYQPMCHHSGNPMAGVYAYSFALKPEEHQPTGTCNFSRIDNAQVQLGLKAGLSANSKMSMFAVNYNVLRIQSGINCLFPTAGVKSVLPASHLVQCC